MHVKQVLLGPFRFTEHQLAAWAATLLALVPRLSWVCAMDTSEIAQLPLEGMFVYHNRGNLCTSCEFKNFCHSTDRSPKAISQFLEASFLMPERTTHETL